MIDPNPKEPVIIKRRRGWFVTGESWSGPWATKEAAELASDGEYTLAHDEHRKAYSNGRQT